MDPMPRAAPARACAGGAGLAGAAGGSGGGSGAARPGLAWGEGRCSVLLRSRAAPCWSSKELMDPMPRAAPPCACAGLAGAAGAGGGGGGGDGAARPGLAWGEGRCSVLLRSRAAPCWSSKGLMDPMPRAAPARACAGGAGLAGAAGDSGGGGRAARPGLAWGECRCSVLLRSRAAPCWSSKELMDPMPRAAPARACAGGAGLAGAAGQSGGGGGAARPGLAWGAGRCSVLLRSRAAPCWSSKELMDPMPRAVPPCACAGLAGAAGAGGGGGGGDGAARPGLA
jgi:hypothetical protein